MRWLSTFKINLLLWNKNLDENAHHKWRWWRSTSFLFALTSASSWRDWNWTTTASRAKRGTDCCLSLLIRRTRRWWTAVSAHICTRASRPSACRSTSCSSAVEDRIGSTKPLKTIIVREKHKYRSRLYHRNRINRIICFIRQTLIFYFVFINKLYY